MQPCAARAAPPSPSDFVAVDEATRLEADEVYRLSRRQPVDPLGAHRRSVRALYDSR